MLDKFVLFMMWLVDLFGYGCVLCDDVGKVQVVVEEKDVDFVQCVVILINIGIFVVVVFDLCCWIGWFDCNNVQGEYYFIDIFVMVVVEGILVCLVECVDLVEVVGVNNLL